MEKIMKHPVYITHTPQTRKSNIKFIYEINESQIFKESWVQNEFMLPRYMKH